MKNFIGTLTVGSIVLFLIAPLASATSFPDVPASQSNSEAIEYAQDNNIVSGYSDGTFKPERTIDRSEFVKIIINTEFDATTINNCISENIPDASTTAFFPDVPKDTWFAKYLCVAKVNNILNGYPDGTFQAKNEISFIESTKIITNAFKYPVVVNALWYKPFVEKLAEKNAIPPTITSFTNPITRGEMTEMIYRLKAQITTKTSLNYETIRKMSILCLGESGGTPVISSISQTSGTIGSKLDIYGCNFSGFEGDTTMWIENSQGVRGILRGTSDSTAELIHVTLGSSLCQIDTSYSDLPCDNRLALSPGKYWIYTAPWGKSSNRVEFTIIPGNQPPFEPISVEENEAKDISLTLVDGKGALKIQYGTGARVNVYFSSEGNKTLSVDLQTPLDINGNIRVSQIVLPDGTMDGPFGKYMTYNVTQSGIYQIRLSPNMMAGDPWSGEITMNLELQ